MQSMVDTLLVNEMLRHMGAEVRAPGAYSNAHLERMAIREMFGEDGLAFADAVRRRHRRG